MKRFKSAVNKVIQLGIQGLPSPVDALPSGHVYGLDFEYADAQTQLIIECLRANLAKKTVCTLATATPLEKLITDFTSHDAEELVTALNTQQLQILTFHTEFAKDVFTHSESSFVHELQALDVPIASLLIIDHSDHLFSLHDSTVSIEQAKACKAWCQKHHSTVLLCFINHPEHNYPVSYRSMTDYFGGAIRIMGHGTEQLLNVDFINGLHGSVAGLCIGFGSTPKNRLHITTTQFSQGPKKIVSSIKKHWYSFAFRSTSIKNDGEFSLATEIVMTGDGDDENVLFLGEELIDLAPRGGTHLENAPSADEGRLQVAISNISVRWKQVESSVELLNLAQSGRALTVLIDYTPNIDFVTLVELIYVLRNTTSPTIKIMVREDGTTLRYHGADLLLRLGVNTIFTTAMSRKRLPLLMDFIRGHMYTPKLHLSLDEVIRHAQPVEVCGYLPLETFVDEVEILLERASHLDIPCLFIIFPELSKEKNNSLINGLKIRGHGDLLSIAKEQIFLFLFSCADHDIKKVMSRILPLEFQSSISPQKVIEDHEIINQYLNQLEIEHIKINKADLIDAIAHPKTIHSQHNPFPGNSFSSNNDARSTEFPIVTTDKPSSAVNQSPGSFLITPQHTLQKRPGNTPLKTLLCKIR